VIHFIMNQKIATNIIFMKITQQLHVAGLQIELYNFFVHHNGGEEIFF
jgi:hypothetical protein